MAGLSEDEAGELIDINEVLGASDVIRGDLLTCYDVTKGLRPRDQSHTPSTSKANRRVRNDMWALSNDSLLKEVQILRESNKTLQDNGSLLIDQFHSQQSDLLKVREKVSVLFQENCSLQEQLAKQCLENRSTKEKFNTATEENAKLRRRLDQISQQLKGQGDSESSMGQRRGSPTVSRQYVATSRLTVQGNRSWQVAASGGEAVESDYDSWSSRVVVSPRCQSPARGQQGKSSSQNSVEAVPSLLEVFDILGDEEALKLVTTCCRKANRLKASLQHHNDSLKLLLQKTADLTRFTNQDGSVQNHLSMSMPNLNLPPNPGTEVPNPYSPEASRTRHKVLSDSGNIPTRSTQRLKHVHEDKPDLDAYQNVERICPLCEFIFPSSYPQREFEAHVMGHFACEEFEIIDDSS